MTNEKVALGLETVETGPHPGLCRPEATLPPCAPFLHKNIYIRIFQVMKTKAHTCTRAWMVGLGCHFAFFKVFDFFQLVAIAANHFGA